MQVNKPWCGIREIKGRFNFKAITVILNEGALVNASQTETEVNQDS